MSSFVPSALSLIGATFVAAGYALPANVVWCISNPLLIWHNYKAGDLHQARMFAAFAVLAILGVIREVVR